jgi:ubiquinone/menaquinone biosynthesis C-methylase UbiE
MEPEQHRRAQADQWSRSAAGWTRRREDFQRRAMPVSRWLIDAVELQPGQAVLELAGGPGDTGLLAAELVAPGGRLISSDAAEEMLAAARARAAELGIENVEFRVLELEWLDLETASVDAVLCRWGYMLVADPGAALRETRRVLRPGGRVALAAWDAPQRNPWATAPTAELVERGLTEPRDPLAAGMFAFSPTGRLEALLEEAGFTDVTVDTVELELGYASFEDFWETTLDLSIPFADVVGGLEGPQRQAVMAGLRERLRPYTGEDGALAPPARTLVASASA